MTNKEIRIEKIVDMNKSSEKEDTVEFLHTYLDRYRDKPDEIEAAVDYALTGNKQKKGYVLKAKDRNRTVGCVVMNETGMKGYVPPHFLVYIAVHRDYRGRGIGKRLLERVKKESTGNISLHVEYDNPAKKLYEAVGFKSKYAEMRLQRD
jgi:ribosomal protein S18 acetylase RimI-like enzyme